MFNICNVFLIVMFYIGNVLDLREHLQLVVHITYRQELRGYGV